MDRPIDPPRLIRSLPGGLEVVLYQGRYYRVPLAAGPTNVDCMTEEQKKLVRVFDRFSDVMEGTHSVQLRGATLIEVNKRRVAAGMVRLSRTAAEVSLRHSPLHGRENVTDAEVADYLVGPA
jgi:hypothetical protein